MVAAAVLAAAAGVAAGAKPVSPYRAITIPLKLDQIPGKPIWYSTGSPGIPGKDNEGNTSNAGFVVTSDGVVVFDALGNAEPRLGAAAGDPQGHGQENPLCGAKPLSRRSHLWLAGVQGSHRRDHCRARARGRIQG